MARCKRCDNPEQHACHWASGYIMYHPFEPEDAAPAPRDVERVAQSQQARAERDAAKMLGMDVDELRKVQRQLRSDHEASRIPIMSMREIMEAEEPAGQTLSGQERAALLEDIADVELCLDGIECTCEPPRDVNDLGNGPCDSCKAKAILKEMAEDYATEPAAPAEQPHPLDNLAISIGELGEYRINFDMAQAQGREPAAGHVGAERFRQTYHKQIQNALEVNEFAEAYAAARTKGFEAQRLQAALDGNEVAQLQIKLEYAEAMWERAGRKYKAAEARNVELMGADVQRVKDISRLTIERDEALEKAMFKREAEQEAADLRERLAEAEKALAWTIKYLKKLVTVTEDGATFVNGSCTELAGFAHKLHEIEARSALPPSERENS